ncbi:OpgC family protein [Pararhizobium arenae]|uniref:OpgC family protein n=1 Tax=Pararhizobium arenae TaxID=1856850 RepID=UPI00094B5A05|nr:OpgC domain-containing protein [Pararhizobium arenae]
MKRYEIMDGMRGYFLVFMLINHLVFTGGYWLLFANHNQLAFVEDAQGFVFLSGLLVGMVYSRKMMKDGYFAGSEKVTARAFELYRYAMGIVIAVLAVALVLPNAPQAWFNWIGSTNFDDPMRLAAVATFLFQPTFMDILPQYVVYMLFAPPVIWLCLKGRWAEVMTVSLLLWLAGQLGLQRLVTDPVNSWIMGPDKEGIRVSFNLLGWQIVFFSGLVLGVLTSANKIEWDKVFDPQKTFFPKVAAAVLLFFLPLRILTAHDLMPEAVLAKFATMEVRADFGPVYLLSFPAAAFLVTWLIVAGPKHSHVAVRKAAAVLHWVFTLGFLRLLGRHSLHVYVWHVAIVYGVYYIDQQTPIFSQLEKTLIALFAVATLALPALWRERDKWLSKPPQKATLPAGGN